ncbi:DNA-binding helix-turn-helix protein [Striga asiatica]|uniref:DNA-binding helix-turn-helix protein n=1 Tax=Striga asiatica TaxID=4170 RepID=A0A5A7Q945_STRAF|nr:DNA-binding helix-turn-helix protein [Striga asiatica]
MEDVTAKCLREGQYGEWMRAVKWLQGQLWNMENSSSGQEWEQVSSPTLGDMNILSNDETTNQMVIEMEQHRVESSSSKVNLNPITTSLDKDNKRSITNYAVQEKDQGQADKMAEDSSGNKGSQNINTKDQPKRTLPSSMTGMKTCKSNTKKEGKLLKSAAESGRTVEVLSGMDRNIKMVSDLMTEDGYHWDEAKIWSQKSWNIVIKEEKEILKLTNIIEIDPEAAKLQLYTASKWTPKLFI